MFVLVPAVGVAETFGGAVAADEVLIGLEDTLLAACKAGCEIATAVVSPNTSVDPVDGGTSTVPLFRFRNTLAGGKAGRANLDLSGDGREYGVPQVSQSICRFFVIGVVVGVLLLPSSTACLRVQRLVVRAQPRMVHRYCSNFPPLHLHPLIWPFPLDLLEVLFSFSPSSLLSLALLYSYQRTVHSPLPLRLPPSPEPPPQL